METKLEITIKSKKYDVTFDDTYKSYKNIIFDIFDNNNINYDLNDSKILNILGIYYELKMENYDEMKKYYLMAIELNNVEAMYNLGFYYQYIEKNYDEMKKYYLRAIKLNNVDSMFELGYYYKSIEKNYSKMKKYFLMVVEFNNIANKLNNIYAIIQLNNYYRFKEKKYSLCLEYKNSKSSFIKKNKLQFLFKKNKRLKRK